MINRIKFALQGRSSKWHEVRHLHLLVQGSCRACDSRKKLEVHHIQPFDLNPELELEPSNLITLCRKCHLIFGHFGSYRTYNPNVQDDSSFYYLRKLTQCKKIG